MTDAEAKAEAQYLAESRRIRRSVINPREVFNIAEAAVRSADPDIADWMIEHVTVLCEQIQDKLLATKLNKIRAVKPDVLGTAWTTQRGDVIDQQATTIRRALDAQNAPLAEAWTIILGPNIYGVRDEAKLADMTSRRVVRDKLSVGLPLTAAETDLVRRDAARPADRPVVQGSDANTYPTAAHVAQMVEILREIVKERPDLLPSTSKDPGPRPPMTVSVDTSITYDPAPAWMRADPLIPLKRNPIPLGSLGTRSSKNKDEGSLWWFHRQMIDRYALKYGTRSDTRELSNAADAAIVQVLAPEGMPPIPQRGKVYTKNELQAIVSLLMDTWPPLWAVRAFADRYGGSKEIEEALSLWREKMWPITVDTDHYRSLWSRKRGWWTDETNALNLDTDPKDPDVFAYTPANLSKLAVFAFQKSVIPRLEHAKFASDPRLYGFGADPDALMSVFPKALDNLAWDVPERLRRDGHKTIPASQHLTGMKVHESAGESGSLSAGGIGERRTFALPVLRELRKLGIPYGQTRVPWTTLKRAVEAAGGTWVKKDRNGVSEITPDPKLGIRYIYRGSVNEPADTFAHRTVSAMVAEVGLTPLDTPAKR
jgi:hypothetical protein